jgi:hypothetical protein
VNIENHIRVRVNIRVNLLHDAGIQRPVAECQQTVSCGRYGRYPTKHAESFTYLVPYLPTYLPCVHFYRVKFEP